MKIRYTIPIILMTILCIIPLYYSQTTQKYDLITYDRFLTLQDDGGTHYDRKYTIDFSKKTITKKEDYYKGFEGIQYKDKILYQKKLSHREIKQLKNIIKNIINNQQQYNTNREIYYSLYYNHKEIKISDKNTIQKLEKILKK